MIQRRQTLWLLLATAAALLGFWFPFATGKIAEGPNMEKDVIIIAGENLFLLLLSGASVILSTIIIFLFKTRKLQAQLCIAGILLSAGLIAVYIMELGKTDSYVLALSAVLPFIVLISYLMAWRCIRKDEKLVRSLDKLR